ncbi:hypothetical protein ERX46_04550 [Brumimicrobium glaciale]|uniref:Ig-like domain-containing protein n=1 Tax=Brumimicrobium glaciale TaxID=200475 RepID=A0A4Q4KNQ3_9FLAO|nr:hypothetical protein [Brumimicrobium glaciale]RYM34650.1 hypothetical protein ERX46_04550 [Brumimicrobium glaciale]
MKNRSYVLLVFMFVSISSNSQNLIPNGDFETYTSIPTSLSQPYLATGWNNVNGVYIGQVATPDYLHTSGYMGVTMLGTGMPNNGAGQMGMITYSYSHQNSREYISRQLSSTLIIGQEYEISFFLTQGQAIHTGNSDNFGVHFSEQQLVQPDIQNIPAAIPVVPQVVIPGILTIPDFWQQYTFTFIANNTSNYITIGNFALDANTAKTGVGDAYYFIDDVELIPLPTLQIHGDISLCTGDSTTLTVANGTALGWADSSNPSSIISTSSSITVAPLVTTTYFVYSSSDTASRTVSVKDYPVVDLGNDTLLCQGQNLTLDVTTPNANYIWQDYSSNSIFNVYQQGTYSVEVNVGSCSSSDTILVNYIPTPNINLGADTVLCQGQNLLLDVTTPNATYLWQDNSTNPTLNVSQQGTYWVEVTANNCSYMDTIVVNYISTSFIDLGADTTICQGSNYILDASISNATYLWQDNSTNSTLNITQTGFIGWKFL